MSVDNYKYEIHLTPTGWKSGNSWFYNKIQGKETQRPEDAIETWLRHETQSSAYSKPDIRWRQTWQNPNVSENELETIRNKYPREKD